MQGAHGCVVMYDLTDRASFLNVPSWLQELREAAGQDCVILLAANKLDCAAASRKVATREGMELAEAFGLGFMEMSARAGDNVVLAFTRLVAEMVNVHILGLRPPPPGPKQQRHMMQLAQQYLQSGSAAAAGAPTATGEPAAVVATDAAAAAAATQSSEPSDSPTIRLGEPRDQSRQQGGRACC